MTGRLRMRARWYVALVGVLALGGMLLAPAAETAAQAGGDPAAVVSERLAGANRYATAAEIALDGWGDDGAEVVVVTTGQNFPDAVAGNYLAGQLDAPILLTRTASLPAVTSDALAELGATGVVLLGGPNAVSPDVEDALAGDYEVTRVDGPTRVETAVEAALAGDEIGTINDQATAFLATAVNFPDALAAGPLAWDGAFPVLLTRRDSLPAATLDALEELEIDRVVLVGGPNAISPQVRNELAGQGYSTDRVWGADRSATAAALAGFARAVLDFDFVGVDLAAGWNYPDALTGGPHAGLEGSPILLTRNAPRVAASSAAELGAATADFLADHCGVIEWLLVFGGPAAVSQGAENRAVQEASCPADEPAAGTQVAVLHDTHLHGKFGGGGQPTIAQYFGFANERLAAHEHALFLANGDDIAPSLHSGVFRGDHMIDALNVAPVDANTFGNHEFDYGPDRSRHHVAMSTFPWVSANVRDLDTGDVWAADLGAEPFILREFDDVTLGITGLGPRDMASVTSMTHEDDESGAEQVSDIDAMQELVPDMEAAGADVIVVTSHLSSPAARDLAEQVDGIDLIVGDHHSIVNDDAEIINDTILSFVGHEFMHMGEVVLDVVDGEITDFEWIRHDLVGVPLEPDPDVAYVMDHYNAQLDEELNVVIGERTVEWDTRTPDPVRMRENAFGNFMTDEMRDWADADVAIQNSGGIRADSVFPPGDITRRDIAEILPFDNYTVKAQLSGETLWEVLESSVSRVGTGAFLQVSGIRIVYDPDADAGDRLVSVDIGDEPLDPNETYTLATNDFTLGGGDGYTMLADRDRTEVLIPRAEGRFLAEFIMERVEAIGTVTTDIEGRITTVD